MTEATLPTTRTLRLEEIRPYWNNPRVIPDGAVEALRRSIETYGYQQPIMVDADNVIIVGHTRYAALQRLDVEQVIVYVGDHLSPDQVKEYRLVDNRTGEMTSWNHDHLIAELREWEESLVKAYFPDVELEIGEIEAALAGAGEVTAADVEKAQRKVAEIKPPARTLTTEVVCPACFESFDVRTDTLPGLNRLDLEALAAADDGRAE